jgi:hypothetical protein
MYFFSRFPLNEKAAPASTLANLAAGMGLDLIFLVLVVAIQNI